MSATCRYSACALLFLLLVCASSDAADLQPKVFATAPPKSVTHWIWFQIVGLRNHPFPIIYVSTKRFDTRVPEVLIVVARPRFNIMSRYMHLRMANPDCVKPLSDPNAIGTVEIAVHDNGQTLRCLMPQAAACKFLADVKAVPGMDWTADELKPITDLAINVGGCHYRQDTNGKWHHEPQ